MIRLFTLASGSSGNSTYVGTEDEGILIDAGISTRRILKALEGAGISAGSVKGVVVTHEHRDHIAGLEYLSRKCQLPIYCTEKTGEYLQQALQIAEDRCCCFTAGQTFEVGKLKVESFPLSHDAVDPAGVVVNHKETRVGLATDTGMITSRIKKALQDCQALVVEANHDIEMLKKGRYPYPLKQRILSQIGHLSNDDAGSALLEVISGKTERVVLAHLSAENNRADLALKTVAGSLSRGGIGAKQSTVSIAPRNEPHPLIKV